MPPSQPSFGRIRSHQHCMQDRAFFKTNFFEIKKILNPIGCFCFLLLQYTHVILGKMNVPRPREQRSELLMDGQASPKLLSPKFPSTCLFSVILKFENLNFSTFTLSLLLTMTKKNTCVWCLCYK